MIRIDTYKCFSSFLLQEDHSLCHLEVAKPKVFGSKLGEV